MDVKLETMVAISVTKGRQHGTKATHDVGAALRPMEKELEPLDETGLSSLPFCISSYMVNRFSVYAVWTGVWDL